MFKRKQRWLLAFYDSILYLLVAILILFIYPGSADSLTPAMAVLYGATGLVCVLAARFLFGVYEQIWRYAGPGSYMRIMIADAIATVVFLILRYWIPGKPTFVRTVSLFALSLLFAIAARLLYQWIYQNRSSKTFTEKIALKLLKIFTGVSFADEKMVSNRIKVAIVGAGSVGVALSDELNKNPIAAYDPVCFVDVDEQKAGRDVKGIPVIAPNDALGRRLKNYSVQEVIFALPSMSSERRFEIYTQYKDLGYKIKAYEYPSFSDENGGKRQIRDFDIEDLLFRQTSQFLSEETMAWYRDKHVLITGGGGSIGSELARQIARCKPARLTILDNYENGAYDVQQELRTRYGDDLVLKIEIANVCDKEQMEKIFREHHYDIVLHAAAHKHVPLMERNVIEAVRNNVFGTLNVVESCEKYGVSRFIMISTDKAVNPTNVMGATKRMCEMIVQSRDGKTTSFSATRFGNVLGSNGSVIPLFKRQILNGGPVTVTDKRIVRYFMTIPEASQLVMTSGAMAKNGELYVLDMGKPVKIMKLAENMIRLSGLEPYKDIDIVETGLRPGEKLYEELLIKTEELNKTDNEKIFVEKDKPLPKEQIDAKLRVLKAALETESNRVVKQALMQVVPTYRTPEEVNSEAINAAEMAAAAQS